MLASDFWQAAKFFVFLVREKVLKDNLANRNFYIGHEMYDKLKRAIISTILTTDDI